MCPAPRTILTSAVCRGLHTGIRAPPIRPTPTQRYLHRTAPAFASRRKRNFFTSNVLLQHGGGEGASPQVQAQARPGPAASPPVDRHAPRANAGQNAPPTSSKPKPPRSASAKNSLRRVALLAQNDGGRHAPSRSSPRPQQPPHRPTAATAVDAGDQQPDFASTISAVCVAEAFDMTRVMDILSAHGFLLDPDGTGFDAHEVVHARGVNSGDIFVFPSGTIVTWSLAPDVVNRLATRQLLPAAEDPHVARLETENLEFVRDPDRETSSIYRDVVVLGTQHEARSRSGDPRDTTLAKIAFSSGLARSTKLSVLESRLETYFESTKKFSAMLSGSSSSSSTALPSTKLILHKTGELLSLRSQLNHYNELTDALPDIFWDQKSDLKLDNYYDKVGRALDVQLRIDALNQKITFAQEEVAVLREMASQKHSTRLELIIIVLIAVEVLFELRRVYTEKQAERLAAVQER